MSRVSVFMIAQNEAARIGASLASVRWADEIIVVDGGSTDDTVQIAESLGARVLVNPWPGFPEQLRVALDATTEPWVFRLDADEVVTAELANQLRESARTTDDSVAGFRVRRKNYFLGRWIRHGGWWPDSQLRLVRRSGAHVRGAPGHETVHIEGETRDLDGALEHDTHPTVHAALSRVERYSTLLAVDRARRKTIRPIHLFAHPFAAFFRKYLVQSGWRDGVHGFLVAGIHAMVKFSVYARAWDLQRTGDS